MHSFPGNITLLAIYMHPLAITEVSTTHAETIENYEEVLPAISCKDGTLVSFYWVHHLFLPYHEAIFMALKMTAIQLL